MSFQPGDIVVFKAHEFNQKGLHGQRARVLAQVSVDCWAVSGPIDKYVIEMESNFTFPALREVWGDNLELLILDTMAAIK